MSLFRNLAVAALEADLGKNALKVFTILLHQTLGYGKERDPLTDRQMAKLSGVRLDRVRPAIQAVLQSGIYERTASKSYDWYYCIGETYLAAHQKACQKKNPNKTVQFFTPALPKNGAHFRKSEAKSEKQSHTALDLDPFLSYLQPLLQLLIPKPVEPAMSTEMLTESVSLALSNILQPLVDNIQQLNQHLINPDSPAAMRVSPTATTPQRAVKAGVFEDNKEPSPSQDHPTNETHRTESTPQKSHFTKNNAPPLVSEKQTKNRDAPPNAEKQTESRVSPLNPETAIESKDSNLNPETPTENRTVESMPSDEDIPYYANDDKDEAETSPDSDTTDNATTVTENRTVEPMPNDDDIPYYANDDKDDAETNPDIAKTDNATTVEESNSNSAETFHTDSTEKTAAFDSRNVTSVSHAETPRTDKTSDAETSRPDTANDAETPHPDKTNPTRDAETSRPDTANDAETPRTDKINNDETTRDTTTEAKTSPDKTNPATTAVKLADLVKIKLPAAIQATSYQNCYAALALLEEEKQHSVLSVFTTMEQQNKIHSSATGLFLTLAEAARYRNIEPSARTTAPVEHIQPVFKGDPKHPNIQWDYQQTPQIPRREPITEAEKRYAADKAERERQIAQRQKDHSELELLKLHSRASTHSIEEQARMYYLTHILALFPEEVAAFKKQYETE